MWILYTRLILCVCEELENFENLRINSTYQHVHASHSRVKRVMQHVDKLVEWLTLHESFPKIQEDMSVASGVVGQNSINCHYAYEIGQIFDNVNRMRKDIVVPLLSVSYTGKVQGDLVLLFQRMSVTNVFQDELEIFFKYKFAPYPLTFWDEAGMRKTQKSL